jgi:hypothetical protein
VKSFSASSQSGIVKVILPDTGAPQVFQNGRLIVEGVPQVVYGEATDGPPGSLAYREPTANGLLCLPASPWEGRRAISITNPQGDTEDVDVALTRAVFQPRGMAPLWGCRLGRSNGVEHIEGLTFTDDGQAFESWDIQLVHIKLCCGRKAPPPPDDIPLPALAFEL